jgi:hypothetical protein
LYHPQFANIELMSGYWPTLLELTPSVFTEQAARQRVQQLLGTKYQAGDAAQGIYDSRNACAFIINGVRVDTEIDVNPSKSEPPQTNVTLHFDSKLYEAVCDPIRRTHDPRAIRALLEFCVDVAQTLHVEGFRFRFDSTQHTRFDIVELTKLSESIHRDPGLIIGVAEFSALCESLRSLWPAWVLISGYYVKEFLS